MKRLIPLFTLVAIVAFACTKPEPESFQFRITVVNEEGIPIQNASVQATAPVINALPDFKGFTGIDGVFRIDNEDVLSYDLPAVLQVTATLLLSSPWFSFPTHQGGPVANDGF